MHILVYDLGTTGVKTCLFKISDELTLLGSEYKKYNLYILENGGAEQDLDELWDAICDTTKNLLHELKIKSKNIDGISFCSQMQSVIVVDKDGVALRRSMNYMDMRASKELKDCMGTGLIKVSGCNLFKVLKNLYVNRAASMSVKDPVYKYKWIENNEPYIFKKVYKWLDVKDYIICRMTGEFVRTTDSAFSTFLYDTRKGKEGWNYDLIKMYKVNPKHLPKIIKCTDLVGKLNKVAADELGLVEGTSVFGGGGDATLMSIGAGYNEVNDTHIYVGTSGWVGTIIDRQVVDVFSMITGVLSAKEGYFNYFAEMETAGKCFDWAKNNLITDEVGFNIDKKEYIENNEFVNDDIYKYIMESIKTVPAGSNGIIFTPWLHGNRCPFESSYAAGMFFNIKLENNKKDMIRAVIEGICLHLRWMLEKSSMKVKTSETIRFVGGLAKSYEICQILADVIGRRIETVENTKEVGATGAALVAAVGSGYITSLEKTKEMIVVKDVYEPNLDNKKIYDRYFSIFKKMYKSNARNFYQLNKEI